QEAELITPVFLQCLPVCFSFFQQRERSLNICADKLAGRDDGAVHMAFRGEMNYGARLMLGEQRPDKCSVADISADEKMARIAIQFIQIRRIAGVGLK